LTETDHFLHDILQSPAILVTVQASKGSVPREVGAWMAVFAQHTVGSIGGGHLEWDAMQTARTLLVQAVPHGHSVVHSYSLGARLGQCCGGQVQLQFERVSAQDRVALAQRLRVTRVPLALFGGGHVGCALVQVLASLPFGVRWIDSRDDIFPDALPANVQTEHSEPVAAAVAGLPAGSLVLIMSYSHAEDFALVAACLERQRIQHDLPYIGLIGSKTKWASFQSRLRARGWSDAELAHITSPIGIAGIRDKRPAVMAVSIAAQLLLHCNPA
jgi:xanthine dehydrogenase accessory factor